MSRAFMKEHEDAPEPKIISARPHSVTPAGLRALKSRLAAAKDDDARRAVQDEIDNAVLVGPPKDRSVVAFGATVTVLPKDQAREQTFTIVGEGEMDVAGGKITDASPLGKALLGSHVGDQVTWQRPVGDTALTVKAIRYDDV